MTPEIVLGPPGTGKTTTLLNYVDGELERGSAPERIAYLSFTRKATEEARGRAMERFKLTKKQLPYFRTIHSLCFHALGMNTADMLEGDRLKEFGDWIGVAVSPASAFSLEEGAAFGFELGDKCLFIDNLARVRGVTLRAQYEELVTDVTWPVVERVSRALVEFKRAKCLVDFTDLLAQFAASDFTAPLDVLFVDEAQDLSPLQWRVIERMALRARRVVVAGDDDQSLYRWSGADVEHFVGMPGAVTVLGQSWRVPQAVQGVAADVIGRVQARRAKAWAPRPEAGLVERVGSLDEIDFGAGEDVLVLSRNSCFLRDDASKLLRSEGVLYEWRGVPSVRHAVVEAVLDWEQLRRGERVTVAAAQRVYELMASGHGYARGQKKLPDYADRDAEVDMAELRERGGLLTDAVWHEAFGKLTAEERAYMLRALRRGEKLARRPTVRLSTIHGSKGGEADHVVLMRDQAWRTYREAMQFPDDEARVFYVAATRARKRLTIVKPQTRKAYDV